MLLHHSVHIGLRFGLYVVVSRAGGQGKCGGREQRGPAIAAAPVLTSIVTAGVEGAAAAGVAGASGGGMAAAGAVAAASETATVAAGAIAASSAGSAGSAAMAVSGTFAASVATVGMWGRPITSALRGNALTDRGTVPKKEFGYDLRNGANPMDIIPPHAVENEWTNVES
ncbi:hypothetical protein GCM10010437_056490 [Actinoplanes palleronii]